MLPLLLASALAAAPYPTPSLHEGWTEEWVRFPDRAPYASADSTRVRLRALGPRTDDSGTLWPIEVTYPELATPPDTGILRLFSFDSSRGPCLHSFDGVMVWKRATSFPVDLQVRDSTPSTTCLDPQGTMAVAPIPLLKTGNLSLFLQGYDVPPRPGDEVYLDPERCTQGEATRCWGPPTFRSRPGAGTLRWLDREDWRLRTLDGQPVADSVADSHVLAVGETWIYGRYARTSLPLPLFPTPPDSAGLRPGRFALTLLAPPADSAEWRTLRVRVRTSDSAGSIWTDSVKTVRLNRLRRSVHTDADAGSIAELPLSDLGLWALGLIFDPIAPAPDGDWTYSWEDGTTATVTSSSALQTFSSNTVRTLRARRGTGALSWTRDDWGSSASSPYTPPFVGTWDRAEATLLLSHSLDASILSASPKPLAPSRHDLAWLRERMARNPRLEVEQVFPDGRRLVHRGSLPDRAQGFSLLVVPDAAGSVAIPFLVP